MLICVMPYPLPTLSNFVSDIRKQSVIHLCKPFIDTTELKSFRVQDVVCENYHPFILFKQYVSCVVDTTLCYKQSAEFSSRKRTDCWHVDASNRLKAGTPGLVFVYASHTPTLFKDVFTFAGLSVFSQDVLHRSPDMLECVEPRLFMRLIVPIS